MGITGILKRKMLLMNPFSLRGMSRLASPADHRKNSNENLKAPAATAEERPDTASCWMPHHRTGIYFPEGQEGVMDGIPNGAASLDCTFWFRSIDGVDHHKPDD